MAISHRARFLATSVTITVIALSLFTHVIYDKAIIYKHSLQQESYKTLSSQLVATLDTETSLADYRSRFNKLIDQNNQPALLYILRNIDRTLVEVKSDLSSISADQFSQFDTNTENSSQFEFNKKKYFWVKYELNIPHHSKPELVIVYPLSSSALTETIDFFGAPLFTAGILLLWCMVWASIILSSLVTKLQKQKQTVTEQAADIKKARDEALLANTTKSRFLANMSHEIRTPLTSIIGFAESCLDASQTMQQRFEATSTIIRSGRHLLSIINDILDVSKIEAGKLEVEKQPVRLYEVLGDVEMFIKILAEEKGLIFEINYIFPLPESIDTDPLRLKQVLINLCSNAIKFTEKGQVILKVSFVQDTSSLKLEVIDSGIGMTEDQLKTIFDPFQQADSSITREYGGTGLGLSLSKQLVEMLDGKLVAESVYGQGSHFSVELRQDYVDQYELVQQFDTETKKATFPYSSDEFSHVSGTILVAEDNPDIRSLVKMLITKTGASLTIVNNGQQAVDKIIHESFDLVLLDIQMPVMGGFEALKKIRSSGYKKPVFAMTANTMKKDQDKCFSSGFDGFIGKPIDKNELYSVVIDYLQQSKNKPEQISFITSTLLEEEPQLIDLIDVFLERMPELISDIDRSFAEKNWEDLAKSVHQLKGIGGGFGYEIVTKISEKIEFCLTAKDYEQIQLLIDELDLVCEQAIAGKEENHKIIKSRQL